MSKVASCVFLVHKTFRSTRQLVFCVLSMSKVTLCVFPCVRPAEVPGSLSFVSFITAKFLVTVRFVKEQYSHLVNIFCKYIFHVKDTLFEYKMVSFPQEQTKFRWIS